MSMPEIMQFLNDWFLGWPLIIFTLLVAMLCTVATKFVQCRYFTTIWKYALKPEKTDAAATGDVTPMQAFLNTLSANLGNGSLAGMATAVYAGGPGAVLWVVIIGILLMAVRFAEVYLSGYFGSKVSATSGLGGPMLYLKKVIGGSVLSYVYGLFVFFFSLIVGNAIQTNTIGLSLKTTWNIPPMITAVCLFLFVTYIVLGGAKRIARASEAIVPLKVGTFFTASFLVLAYHWQAIIPALRLIYNSAFSPLALAGGAIGFSVQQAMRFGISRAIFATEAGLGTAAILYGFTKSKTPTKDALFSMLSTFISTLVCLLVGLCIVASGVWHNGLNSSALTISAFETVFGNWGGWIVSFLSVSFGIGVLVSFAYIAKEAWLYVTGGRFAHVFTVLYCATAFAGTLSKVDFIWDLTEVVNAIILTINLFGIVYLLPVIKRGIESFDKNPQSEDTDKNDKKPDLSALSSN